MMAARRAWSEHTALVTGGGSGIGREVCRQFAALGATVIVADINEAAAVQTTAELEGAHARGHVALQFDTTDSDSVSGMMKRIADTFGSVQAFVHSAGIGVERKFLDCTLAEWRRIIDVDLTGTFLCSQAIASLMVAARYGRIVHLASTAGIRGGTGRAAYGAAKGGVIALTKVMAVELAEFGITVNALAPGAIETELVMKMHSAKTREVYRRGIPLDRYGSPAETAAAAVFLASPEAAYITGEVLAVDGGFLAAGVMHRD